MAQAVITCELCEDEPVLMHCNSCHIKLCSECVGKHVSSLISKKHDVVGFKYRQSDVTLPECNRHQHQKCDIYCKNCNTPICSRCVVSPEHKQHEIFDIMDEYLTRRELLSQETTVLERFVIPEFNKMENLLNSKMAKLSQDYESATSSLISEVEKIHLEINRKFEEKKTILRNSKDSDLGELRSQMERFSKRHQEAQQTASDYRTVLSGKNVADVFSCTVTENQFREIPSMVEIFPPKYSPSQDPNSIEALLGKFDFGNRMSTLHGYTISTIQNNDGMVGKRFLSQLELLSSFDSGYEEIQTIACAGNDEIWVVGKVHGTMTKFNIKGTKLETLQVIEGYSPNDVSVDGQGNILFCDMGENSVVMWNKGKRDVVTVWKNWKPTSLFVNKLGHILVSMVTADKKNARVVRLVRTRPKQKIQFDDRGEQLFFRPQAIVENRNEDICVVNSGSKGLVVVNKSGILRFIYNGNQISQTFFFRPTSVVTDSFGQILVTDAMNNCVHILDEDGALLLCVGRSMMNIPSDLDIDENENLWIGEYHSGNVKVFRYLAACRNAESIPPT
ncbi:uncharacterized protein LOC133195931 [Saccostrea echinata]|uniref:uncharacterized protein LOC133195931 n=1 Tax=Saccostrea echinata TaxID=191078 RepID=UPI002A80A718|nr:uncharacterized protein LOC133195931 [Saccostrea echinata]